jgi:hypothetical protein
MAAVNAFESRSKSIVKLQAEGLVGIIGVEQPQLVTQNPCKGCCKGKNDNQEVEDNEAFVAEARSIRPNISVACTQPPPGVTIQLEPRTGATNIVICTQIPAIPPAGGDGNGSVASGNHSGHGGNLREEAFLSGLNRLFLVLFLLALGSTLWYQRKYQQAVNANQPSKVANKPKAQ